MGCFRGLAGVLWRWLSMPRTWLHEGPFDVAAAQAHGQTIVAVQTHGQTATYAQIYVAGSQKGQVDA